MDLLAFMRLFSGSGLFLISLILLGAFLGGVRTYVATPMYRAEATVVPVSDAESASVMAALQSSLGGLASLAGIELGGSGGTSQTEALAILTSRSFIEGFVRDENLLPVLFANRWNDDDQAWQVGKKWIFFEAKQPTLEDGFEFFANKVFSVNEDRRNGLVVVQAEWSDRQIASDWVNKIIARVNRIIREQVIEHSDFALGYLQKEVAKTDLLGLQQVMYAVMETHLQKTYLGKDPPRFRI